MQITDLRIRKLFEESPMKAIISATFDNQLVVHDIKVICARERYFVVMPSKRVGDDGYRDVAHPITYDFRKYVEKTVMAAYWQAVEAAKNDPDLYSQLYEGSKAETDGAANPDP